MNGQTAKIFLAVAEHGSISAAAQELYLTQPAVSSHIGRLEEDLGIQLIIRQRGVQKITLTQAGQAFIPVATQYIEADKTLMRFRESFDRKLLRLAGGVYIHDYIIAPIAGKLLLRDPGLSVQLGVAEAWEREDAAKEQRYDAAFYFCPPDESPPSNYIPFFDDPLCVLCPADTPLPDRVLTPEDLDPAFEIRQTFLNRNLREWHERFFPKEAACYETIASYIIIHTRLVEPRCWAFMPTSVSLMLMAQNPGKLALRHVDPIPAVRHCYIYLSRFYSRKDVVDNLLRSCREYLEERPLLKSRLPEDL